MAFATTLAAVAILLAFGVVLFKEAHRLLLFMGYKRIPKPPKDIVDAVQKLLWETRFDGMSWEARHIWGKRNNQTTAIDAIDKETKKQAHAVIEYMLLVPRK